MSEIPGPTQNETSHNQAGLEIKPQGPLSQLETKIRILNELRRLIDSATLDESHEAIKRKFLDFEKQCFTQLSPTTKRKVAEVIKLRAIVKRQDKSIRDLESSESENSTREMDKMVDQSNATNHNIKMILEDPEVKMMENIHRILKDLLSKNKYIKSKEKDYPFIQDVKRDTSDLIVDNTHISPFSVSFGIEHASWKKRFQTIAGFYVKNSPYIFYDSKRDRDAVERTLRHEGIHNFFNTSLSINYQKPQHYVQKLKLAFEQFVDPHMLPMLLPLSMGTLASDISRHMVDGLQEELITGYFQAKYASFGFQENAETVYQETKGPLQDAFFLNKIRSFRTAGRDFRLALTELNQFIRDVKRKYKGKSMDRFSNKPMDALTQKLWKNISHVEPIKALEKQYESIKRRGNNVFETIRFLSRFTQELGADAENDLEALLILLKPSQYHIIFPYLKRKYRATAAEAEVKSRWKIMSEDGDLSLENLSQFNLSYAKHPITLPPAEAKQLGRIMYIYYNDISNINTLGMDISVDGIQMESLPEQVQLLNSLYTLYTIAKRQEQRSLAKSITTYIEYSCLGIYTLGNQDQFETIISAYDTLSSPQLKKAFTKMLTVYRDSGFIDDVEEAKLINGDTLEITDDEIINLPHWAVFEHFGIKTPNQPLEKVRWWRGDRTINLHD